MSDQQLLSIVQEIFGVRRELCACGFVDQTAGFREELGPKVIFAISKRLAEGTVSFVALDNEGDTRREKLPIGIQVIAHDHGFAPEVGDFSGVSLSAALGQVERLCSRFGFDSIAA